MIATWIKFVHVAMIAVWAAGLIALPFLYAQRRRLEGDALHRLHAFARFFYVAIISPAAFIAIGSGTVLIFMMSTYENWFSAKMAVVAVLTGIHIFSGLLILRLFEPNGVYPAWRMALVLPLTIVVVATILTLVLAKPQLAWPQPLADFFAPGALSQMTGKVIDATI